MQSLKKKSFWPNVDERLDIRKLVNVRSDCWSFVIVTLSSWPQMNEQPIAGCECRRQAIQAYEPRTGCMTTDLHTLRVGNFPPLALEPIAESPNLQGQP